MIVSRGLSLTALSSLAMAWAGCIAVPGLWLLFYGPATWPRFAWPCIMGGLAALAASVFIFLVLVVGRLFPEIGRRSELWALEMVMFSIFVIAGLGSMLSALRAGAGGIA